MILRKLINEGDNTEFFSEDIKCNGLFVPRFPGWKKMLRKPLTCSFKRHQEYCWYCCCFSRRQAAIASK